MDPLVKEKHEAHKKKSRRLSKVDMGQLLFFQHTKRQNWRLGKVADVLGLNTYQLSGLNGGM